MIKEFFAPIFLAFSLFFAPLASAQTPGGVAPMLFGASGGACAQGGNDGFTKVLLHLSGSNGGTIYTDTNAGGSAHAWGPVTGFGGAPITTTSNFKFGPSSLLTPGQSWIQAAGSSDFVLGTGDFTIDFWFNNNNASSGGTYSLAGLAVNSSPPLPNWAWAFQKSGTSTNSFLQFVVGNGVGTSTLNSTTNVVGATWNHVAITRAIGTIRFFMNGIIEGTMAWNYTIPSVGAMLLGNAYSTANNAPNVLYDEFRFSVGIARWTTNFTPPTAPYCP